MDVTRKQLNLLIAVSIETHVSLRYCNRRGLSTTTTTKKSALIIHVLFLCKYANNLERDQNPILTLKKGILY